MDRITMKKKAALGFFDTKANDDTWRKIGSFSKLEVWVDDSMMEEGYLEVDVVDTSVVHGRSPQRVKRVLSVQLSTAEFNNAFHIDMTQLDYRYAGRGIAAKAYRYIMRKLGVTLQAGSCQSQGGRKVWFDLAKMSDLTVWAQTKYGKATIVETNDEAREVSLPKKEIYDSERVQTFVFASA